MNRSVLIILLVFVLSLFIEAKVISNNKAKSKNVNDNFIALSSFWYGKSGGETILPTTFNYSTNVDNYNGTLGFYFFDDQPGSWPNVSGNPSWTCKEKISKARDAVYSNQISHGQILVNESFDRIWYVVVADCTEGNLIDMEYSFLFHNVGGKYYYQFSMEEQGFWGIFVAFFMLYLVLAIFQGILAYMLRRSNSLHLVVKLFTSVIVLSFFDMMFNLIHYDLYARNGIGSPGSRFFGQILGFSSHWIFIAMLIVIARGVTEHYIVTQKRYVIIVVAILFLLDVIMFIWRGVEQHSLLSPIFYYGTAPSICMLVIRTLMFIYFLLLIRFSFRDEGNPERRSFLVKFGVIGAIWLIFLPFIAVFVYAVSSHSEAVYAMDRAIVGCWNTCCYVIFCIFSFYFFWPSRIGTKFDYSRSDVMIGSGASASSPYETL